MTLAFVLVASLFSVDDAKPDPLVTARERFQSAEAEVQRSVIRDIRDAIERSDHLGVVALLKLRDKARRELKVKPPREPVFFAHSEYAPIQAERAFVDRDSREWGRQYDLMRPWESDPPYYAQTVVYSYAENAAYETGFEITPAHELEDYFLGLVPDTAILCAWLESEFDHDRKLDKVAWHFDHAYCDRVGNCYGGITIYDAFASQMQMEMSDIDVIAYARRVLKDNSFQSPIPGNSKRQRLYDDTREGFLRYFQHRTLCEAAARVFVHPEAWIRPDHEGLRRRLWFVFAEDGDRPDRIRRRLVKHKTRDRLVDALDETIDRNDDAVAVMNRWAYDRNQVRWQIAEITYGVLREYGYLSDG